jgi:AbrB family looped-hinge helix DNA binding protein
MTTYLSMDKAGRVMIPNAVRKELRLKPGDSLAIEKVGEVITLRPVLGTGLLTREHGVWVYHEGQAMPASAKDKMVRQVRQDRDSANLGKNQ